MEQIDSAQLPVGWFPSLLCHVLMFGSRCGVKVQEQKTSYATLFRNVRGQHLYATSTGGLRCSYFRLESQPPWRFTIPLSTITFWAFRRALFRKLRPKNSSAVG